MDSHLIGSLLLVPVHCVCLGHVLSQALLLAFASGHRKEAGKMGGGTSGIPGGTAGGEPGPNGSWQQPAVYP